MDIIVSKRQSPVRSGSAIFEVPKKSGRYFDVKWPIILQNVSSLDSSGMILKVFWLTLFLYRSPTDRRTSLDFPGLLLVFVEIMPDKVILDHKKSYLVKKWKFSKLTKYDILWSKYDYICHDFYKY